MLIGLGLGPGDREMLTLRAVRLLREADKVFVPGKLAQDLVAPYAEAEILEFPMSSDEKEIQEALDRNAKRIAAIATNSVVVLGIIGDPSFYSTFSRQCEAIYRTYPNIDTQVEPGVSSITAFASKAQVSINGGFIVTDGASPETMVVLKVKRPRELMLSLRDRGYNKFVLAEKVFMKDEKIYTADQIPESSDYFSIMYARK